MKKDFTRVNFGWWDLFPDSRPDIFDFGMSRAVAWDCPTTVCGRRLEILDTAPLLLDNLETIRRWETARAEGFFTEDVKKYLRESSDEHTLIVNGEGEYELHRVTEVKCGSENLHAFVFERGGASYASLCYVGDGVTLALPISADKVSYLGSDLKTKLPVKEKDGSCEIFVSRLAYLKASVTAAQLIKMLEDADCRP